MFIKDQPYVDYCTRSNGENGTEKNFFEGHYAEKKEKKKEKKRKSCVRVKQKGDFSKFLGKGSLKNLNSQ